MYGKIFASMYDGSIYGKWEAIVTFQQMIALADKEGTIDMTPHALSARTSIPLEIIQKGINDLESPDPMSRTPDDEGRRITRLDEHRQWGWRITNYQKYREIRTAEERREYHRQYWHKRKLKLKSIDSTETQQTQPIAEAEAEAEALKDSRSSPNGDSPPPVPFSKIVSLYHEILPGLPRVEKLGKTREGYIRQRWKEDLPTIDHWKNFFDYVGQSKFLMGKVPGNNGRPPFRADLGWLIKPTNFINISEEKYHRG